MLDAYKAKARIDCPYQMFEAKIPSPSMNSNQNTLPSFLGNIGMATIVFDVDSVVTACNSLSEKRLGQPVGGLIGRRMAELDVQLLDADGDPQQREGFPLNKIRVSEKGGVQSHGVQFDFGLHLPGIERIEWFRAMLQPISVKGGTRSPRWPSLSL